MVVLLCKNFPADLSVSWKNVGMFTYHLCYNWTEFVFRTLTLLVIHFLHLFNIKYIPLSPYVCHIHLLEVEKVPAMTMVQWVPSSSGELVAAASLLFFLHFPFLSLASPHPSSSPLPSHPLYLPFHLFSASLFTFPLTLHSLFSFLTFFLI